MSASSTIINYLGEGLAANRPAAPIPFSGGLAFYYATDTATLSFYDYSTSAWITVGGGGGSVSFGSGAPSTLVSEGAIYFNTASTPYVGYVQHSSAWHSFSSSGGGFSAGSPPTIVQFGYENSGSASVTLGAAPTNGNTLVALCWTSNNAAGAGWTRQANDASGTDYADILTKVAGSSESATQTPVTGGAGGAIMMWELNGVNATNPIVNVSVTAQQGGPFVSSTAYNQFPNMLTLAGVAVVPSTTITETYGGLTQDVSNSGTRNIYGGHSTYAGATISQIIAMISASGSGAAKAEIIQLTS